MKPKAKQPAAKARAAFKNRILAYELVDPSTIVRNPLNWRTHPESQKSAMTEALERLGFVDTCLVNKRTRHLIDGEMRLDIALENAEPKVPVLWVDLTEEEEKLALATLNPLSELAAADPDRLARVLAGVERGAGPLDELLRELEQQAAAAILTERPRTAAKGRAAAKPQHTLRAVVAITDVATVERAIAMTGESNRGVALLTICKAYIDGSTKEGQRDGAAQGNLESQLAQALAGGAPSPRNTRRRRSPA